MGNIIIKTVNANTDDDDDDGESSSLSAGKYVIDIFL